MCGSAIVRKLLNHGYGKESNGGVLLTPNRKELDLTDFNAVRSWFRVDKPTIVVFATAKVGGILANSTELVSFLLDNIKIQTNFIESAWLNVVKRLLFLGSSCIYPKFSEQPIREESLLTGPLEKTNEAYAIAKITGIKLCSALRKQHGFDSICLMPTNLYGPGDNYHLTNSHVLPAFIRRFYEAKKDNYQEVICWGSGEPLREFLHSDDLGDASVFALESWDPGGDDAPKNDSGEPLNFLNVGTGKDMKISTLANLIAKSIGYLGDIIWDESKPDGTLKKQLDISRLRSMGWEPKINLEDGLDKIIEDFPYQYKSQFLRL